jgi:hypothetical protein
LLDGFPGLGEFSTNLGEIERIHLKIRGIPLKI